MNIKKFFLIGMDIDEIYSRIKRILIIILVAMILICFVAVINLSVKLEDNIQAVNVLISYIGR